MKHYFICIALLSLSLFSGEAQLIYEGRILDSLTKEPLPFVNIKFGDSNRGTATNIDGYYKFSLPDEVAHVQLSYMGYHKKWVELIELKTHRVIVLSQHSKSLAEFVVFPGENPAHRIIRKVAENRKSNDHENKNYVCTNYNKFIFTPVIDSLLVADTSRWNGMDSSQLRMNQMFSRQHLLIIENYVERTHKSNGKTTNNILASRTSGLKQSSLPLLASELQSFSFYEDYITLLDKHFLNPIAPGSIARYTYQIIDTVFHKSDTVYLISFAPKRGKNFDGLEGVLYINTRGYAIENVLAKGEISSSGVVVEIKQRYEFYPSGNWFPVELTTKMEFSNIKLADKNLMGYGKTYMTKVDFPKEIKATELGAFELEVDKNAHKTTDSVWNSYRPVDLDARDSVTYHVVDSIGEKHKLDRLVSLTSSLNEGRFPVKNIIEIDLAELIWYNPYEGIRTGLGLYSGKRIIPWMSAGGYVAYGFKDKGMKHGANATFFLYKKRDVRLFAGYSNDVIRAGYQEFPGRRLFGSSEMYKNLFANLFDLQEKWEVSLSGRATSSLFLHLGGSHQNRESAYDYLFTPHASDAAAISYSRYTFSELSFTMHYAYRQRLSQAFDLVLPVEKKYPQIWFNLRKGVTGFYSGTLDYIKLETLIEFSRFIRNFGRTGLVLRGGWTDANLPLGLLFNGYGVNGRWALSTHNTFETALPNEFIHDRYAAFFFTHNFGSLLFRYKKFEPQFEVALNGGVGTMISPRSHREIGFTQMEQGYYETGLRINNILKTTFSSIGVAAFYRMGAYSLPTQRDNFAFKISLQNTF